MSNKIVERCRTLREIIEPSTNILYFLHVPKTAGTHLAITLQESNRVNVFSLDATEEGFASRIHWYQPNRPIFVRAHLFWSHAYSNFLKYFPNAKAFSVLRSPYALHFSMASMIRDRALQSFKENPMATNQYLKYIGRDLTEFSDLDTFTQLAVILTSNCYKSEYASIYANYFRYNQGHEPNPFEVCSVMSIAAVDQFLNSLLGAEISKQKRRNQTRIGSSTTSSELLNSGILELIHECVPTDELATYQKLQGKVSDLNLDDLTSVLSA